MHRPPIRRAAATAAALAASLAALTAAAPMAGVAGAAPARGPAAAAGGAGSGLPLLLINGDRVWAAPGRAGALTVARAPGAFPEEVPIFSCGQRSVVPAAALPYLGRGLDPDLFSLTALRRAEHGGRLPVRIAYHGARPALPGITLTRAGHGLADGYLTAAAARRFGAALTRQFLADHASGSYGTDGLFASGVTIALPGAAAPARAADPARARPDFPEHILTIKGTNLAGRPDTGDLVHVFDVGHCLRLFSPGNIFFHGVTKLAVPTGHDLAIGEFVVGSGTHQSVRLAVLPQITVHGNTTVHLDARSATSKITFSTPRPARTSERSITLIRSSRSTVLALEWDTVGIPIWVSPVRRPPSFGTLQAYTNGRLNSPPGSGIPYSYLLDFAAPPGVIPPQHYVARPADLATERENYFQDVRGTGAVTTFGGRRAQLETIAIAAPSDMDLPGHQIQYLSAGPRTLWQTEMFGPDFLSGGQIGPFQSYRSGQHASADWNAPPLHPGPNVIAPGKPLYPMLPSASRADNTLTLDIRPFGDSEPGHVASDNSGFGDPAHGRYALFQDGRKIASGGRANGGNPDLRVAAKLSPRPSVIRFMLTAARASKQFVLSAASRDVWTWHSRPDPAATVPPPWACHISAAGIPSRNRHCAVQGMLTARYHVAGLSLPGATRPGPQQISLTITRLELAAPSRITRARLQVSFDHGKTWHTAAVTRLGDTGFRAAFTAPPRALVTLRTHAADAAGDTITETIRDAYRTSAAIR